ncbi:MAG TPA: cytochrome c [Candidatus Acidoferrum sp.]|jgi:mono/diheme cytochrome c family protein|nr:cytochrome c [Candidatus Acidoferrum sp.]
MKTLALAAAVSASFLVFATASAQTPPAESGLLANSAYVKNCAKCHGKTAEGRHFGGPALISAKTAAVSADDLRNIIANGKGHMPKFTGKLTPEEIDSLVAQIQSLNKK